MAVWPCRAAMQVDFWITSAPPGITLSVRGMLPWELRSNLLKDSFTNSKFPSAQASSIVEGCCTREEAVSVVGLRNAAWLPCWFSDGAAGVFKYGQKLERKEEEKEEEAPI